MKSDDLHGEDPPPGPLPLYPILIGAVLAALLGYALGATFDVLELLYDFTRDHEDWDLDELIIALAATVIWTAGALQQRGAENLRRARAHSERLSRRVALMNRLQTQRFAFDDHPNGLLVINAAGRVIDANQTAASLFERERSQLIGGRETELPISFKKPEARCGDAELLSADDFRRPVWVTVSPVPVGEEADPLWLHSFTDLQEMKQQLQELERLAYSDSLTGLPNRAQLKERVAFAVTDTQHRRTQGALIFVDLNEFKAVNDRFGHAVGDLALSETARRLSASVYATDSVTRLSGDEFVLILPDVRDRTGVELILSRIRLNFTLPFIAPENQEIWLRLSMGSVLFPQQGEDPGDLLHKADTAMYAAKTARDRDHYFYDPALMSRD